MSSPVSYCLIHKAHQELPSTNGPYYRALLRKMRYNVSRGAFSVVPCTHEDKCPALNIKQVTILDKQILNDIFPTTS